jgi:3-hydroxybutyryl-CoA dehydrogenase
MTPRPAERVFVAGAGTMGAGIAQVFAQAGAHVLLYDTSPSQLARARSAIAASLDRVVAKGTLDKERAHDTLARIADAPFDQARDADVVVEAIVEDPAAKRELFARLDSVCPAASMLTSNTSSVSITWLGAATSRPERVVGLHFMNPVPVLPLVEVVRGQRTAEATVEAACSLARALQKTPVVAADVPGFIANRILMPMINEAIFAHMEGVATAEAIDSVMTLGMRHPMGPLALADLIGLDVCLAILDVMYEGFGDPKYRACPLLRRMVAAGQLGRKSGEGFYRYS